MGFLSNLFSSARPVPKPAAKPSTQVSAYRLPANWKPAARMDRVILHWTAGAYVASSLDKAHYHFLVEGDLDVVRGLHPVTANQTIRGKTSDAYAAHTLNCNTNSIGVSICAMASAVEGPTFSAGKYPLTEAQWQRAAELVADLCRTYGIPVTPQTVLSHAEVQSTLGITQRGKWDIARLPWNSSIKGAKACGDDFRRRVKAALS